jgi:hypothetical protein
MRPYEMFSYECLHLLKVKLDAERRTSDRGAADSAFTRAAFLEQENPRPQFLLVGTNDLGKRKFQFDVREDERLETY